MSKVALVTGASKGIGRAVAIALAADGYQLAVCARSEAGLKALQGEIPGIATFALDVRDADAVTAMVSDVREKFGRIDVLFNNAGIFHAGTSEISLDDFTEMLEINLKATFHFAHLVAPIMREQKSGHIINISSRSGKVAKPGSGGYAASKFGLVGLNEALYRELSKHGIKVTALCPGWVDTEMATMSGLRPDEMISTDDIVATVRWLLSLSPSACVKDVYMEPPIQVEQL